MASQENETFLPITVETIDQAIFDWFDRAVAAHVKTPNEPMSKVPVLFASGERWATARDQRAIRDKAGLLILPLIGIRRTSITRDRTMLALGTETDRLKIAKVVDQKTNVLQNAIKARNPARRTAGEKVVFEVTTIPFPDWFVTGYEVVIQTQYIQQMNSILEKVFFTMDLQNSFTMPVTLSKFEPQPGDEAWEDRKPLPDHYFVAFLEQDLSDTGNFDEFTDQERIVRYSFNVTVPSYLQLDPEGTRPAIQRSYTSYKVDFPGERVCFVDDPLELEIIFGKNR